MKDSGIIYLSLTCIVSVVMAPWKHCSSPRRSGPASRICFCHKSLDTGGQRMRNRAPRAVIPWWPLKQGLPKGKWATLRRPPDELPLSAPDASATFRICALFNRWLANLFKSWEQWLFSSRNESYIYMRLLTRFFKKWASIMSSWPYCPFYRPITYYTCLGAARILGIWSTQ